MAQNQPGETLQGQPGQFNQMVQIPPGFGKQGFESQQSSMMGKQGFENPQFNYQQMGGNMLFNPSSNFPQNLASEQQGVTSSRFGMQNQPQFPSAIGRGQGLQANPAGDFIPPGLGLGGQGMQGGPGMVNYPNFPPQMFQQGGDPSLKGRGLPMENKPQGYQQDFQSKNLLEREEEHQEQGQSILPPDLHFDDEYHLEEKNYMEEPTAPSILKRVKENRPANLYTAVLSGRMREDSATNSPSLQNLQNKYFSASTPRSAFEQIETPLSQVDVMPEDPSNPPLSEDMIENFKLEDHLGELAEFAKTYNGSR